MRHDWFKTRGYRHFDAPVSISYTQKASDPAFVAKHSWLPLIHYTKRIKRYKSKDGKTVYKDRPIMFASHRDSCILAKYAFDIGTFLDECYRKIGLSDHVIAYRRLGRANYNFASDAYRYAEAHQPCVVLCFDITGFFDNLDHAILKNRLKGLLGVDELSPDWYAVFRSVTKFSKVARGDLEANPAFGKRIASRSREPIATIAEVRAAGISIETNKVKFGIPQRTPISSALSNLYMLDIDASMASLCAQVGALYQRYSDDILVICPPDSETEIVLALKSAIGAHKLEIKDEKTERAVFGADAEDIFQYLGFTMSRSGALIRPSSLARQWRKARRAIKTTQSIGEQAILDGRSDKVYTKRLRRRFAPVGARNFSKYARRAAKAFGSKKIVRQVMRLERMVDDAIRGINRDASPTI
ncbi:reverse transcriptase domain-containing protein [Kaistia sp. MMO-174]|uniref:reverse transcriptase domain-containing protein n=1 Tax=Kaistia sp. MMO-174 TaxID=3081256 RepID=UPI0030171CEA